MQAEIHVGYDINVLLSSAGFTAVISQELITPVRSLHTVNGISTEFEVCVWFYRRKLLHCLCTVNEKTTR